MIDDISRGMLAQLAIFALGVTACWLSQSPKVRARAIAPWFGLAAQPLWLIESITAGQWGIAALSVVYTAAWMRGIWTYRKVA